MAKEGGYLCFVEIKYRENDRYGGSEGTISLKKIRRICRGAEYYMREKKFPLDSPVRFDVVFIIGKQLRVIKNAFSYTGQMPS